MGAGPSIVTIPLTLLVPVVPPPPPPEAPDSGTTETGGTSARELQASVAATAMIETNVQTLRYCIKLSYTEKCDSETPEVKKCGVSLN